MTTNPEQKPKRTPIVLNMHLLYKDEEKKTTTTTISKEAKEVKKEEKNISTVPKNMPPKNMPTLPKDKPDASNDVNGKSSDVKGKNDAKDVGANANKDSSITDDKAKTEGVVNNGPNKGARKGGKGDGNKDDRVCWDFMRNMCNRGDNCKFEHPAPPNVSAADRRRKSWLTLCHDFQNGLCKRLDCRYFHISREDENLYRSSGEIHPHVVDQVMRKALYIDLFGPGVRPSCKEFLKGNCNLPTCRFRHLERREYEDEVFRCLQEEFVIVFGPTEKDGNVGPKQDNYNRNELRNSAWYEAAPGDRFNTPPVGNMQGPVPKQDVSYEPDAKRRRHYSGERSFQYPGDRYRLNDGMEYDRRPPFGPPENVEMERMAQEIRDLRNDKIELMRRLDQEALTLRDEVAHLTRENESMRQENTYMRSFMSDSEMSSKSAVDSLMKTNDNLVEDNKCLKLALQKAESNLDEAVKGKNEATVSLNKAKEAEQKALSDLQKIKVEKESLLKIRDDLKAELERNREMVKEHQKAIVSPKKEPKMIDHPNFAPKATGLGISPKGNPQVNNAPLVSSGPNQQPKGIQQQQPQSLLGEFPQAAAATTSLLGLHPPFAGAAVIKALSEFGASRMQLAQQALALQTGQQQSNPMVNKNGNKENSQLVSSGPNRGGPGPLSNMGSNQGPGPNRGGPGLLSNVGSNQGPGPNRGGPGPLSNVGSNQGPGRQSNFGSNQGPSGGPDIGAKPGTGGRFSSGQYNYGSNQGLSGRSDYGPNQGPDRRSDYGPNQSSGGRGDFGPNQGSGGRGDYGPNKSSGGRGDYGPNQSSGGRGDYGPNQSSSGRGDYGPNQSSVGRSDYGPNQSSSGRSDYGPNQGSGGRSDYGLNQGPSGRADYESKQGFGGRSDYASNLGGAGGRPDFGSSQGPSGRPDYGSSQAVGGRPDFGSSQGPGGRNEYGSSQGSRDRADYGSSQSYSGRPDYGSNLGPSGRSDFGSNQDYNKSSQVSSGRGDYGSNAGPGGRTDYGPNQGSSRRPDYPADKGLGGESNQSRGGLWASDYGISRNQTDQRLDYNSGRGGSWVGEPGRSQNSQSQRSDMWGGHSDSPSKSGYLPSEKDSYMDTSRPRLGERDYGLSGYDSKMRDSSYTGGTDSRGGPGSSMRSSWFREEDTRVGTGKMPY